MFQRSNRQKNPGHCRGTAHFIWRADHGPVPIFSVVDLSENIAAITTSPITTTGAAFFREVNDGKNRSGK